MFFKADEMPFSTDYTEWGLRSSERDCEGPLELAMIMDESDEARPRHRDGHGHQDPGHRRFHLRYRRVSQPPCSTPISAARERAPARESTFAKDLQTSSRPVDWRHRHPKARRGAKTRPKARRREQGTEVELRPLRHNMTKGAF